MNIKYSLLFLEGIFAFISPCMLPMLPLYLSSLAVETEQGRQTGITKTVFFVLGFTSVFIAMGLTATVLGSVLVTHKNLLKRVGGIIICLFGLYYGRILNFNLPYRKSTFKMTNKSTLLGAFLFGAAYATCWTPCLGPMLGSSLMLAANSETLLDGALSLLVFSLGLGVPYIISAVFFSNIKHIFLFLRKHSLAVRNISAILLIAAGILLFFDLFDYWAGLFYF